MFKKDSTANILQFHMNCKREKQHLKGSMYLRYLQKWLRGACCKLQYQQHTYYHLEVGTY